MTAQVWVVSFGDDDDRELTETRIAAELAKGNIGPTSIAWREGMKDWLPIAAIPELAHLVTPPPPASSGAETAPGAPAGAVGSEASTPRATSTPISATRHDPPRPSSSSDRRTQQGAQHARVAPHTVANAAATSNGATGSTNGEPGSAPETPDTATPAKVGPEPSSPSQPTASSPAVAAHPIAEVQPAPVLVERLPGNHRESQPTMPGIASELPPTGATTPAASALSTRQPSQPDDSNGPSTEPVFTGYSAAETAIPVSRVVVVDIDQSTVPTGPLVTIGDGVVTAATAADAPPAPPSAPQGAELSGTNAAEAATPADAPMPTPGIAPLPLETCSGSNEATLPLVLVPTPPPPLDSDAVVTSVRDEKLAAQLGLESAEPPPETASSGPPEAAAEDTVDAPTVPYGQSQPQLESSPSKDTPKASTDGAAADRKAAPTPPQAQPSALAVDDDFPEFRRKLPKWVPFAALGAAALIAVAVFANREPTRRQGPDTVATSAPLRRVSLLASTSPPAPALTPAPTATPEPPIAQPEEPPRQDLPSSSATPKPTGKEFDRVAAERAAEAGQRRARITCRMKKSETSGASVSLTFKPSGLADVVTVAKPHGGTPMGKCLEAVFRSDVRVPPFEGPSGEVIVTVPAR